jgi:hypothetical protein
MIIKSKTALLKKIDTPMSHLTPTIIITTLLTFLIGAGVVYFIQIPTSPTDYSALIQSPCELSGGTFADGACECPLETGQIQEEMYDKQTGYCQTTAGGPGGAAFAVSVGLPNPDGAYAFWQNVVRYNCTESGGEFFMMRCKCAEGKVYNDGNGFCE